MSTAKPMTPPLTVEELMRLVEAYADADHICCLTAVNDTERGDGNRSRTEKAYVDVVATRDALRASLERALAQQKEALPTNTRDAIAVLYSHDLREEAERLETVSDGCKCVDCTDTGVVEPASLPEEPSERAVSAACLTFSISVAWLKRDEVVRALRAAYAVDHPTEGKP